MNMLFILFLFFLLVLVTEDDEVNPVCLFKFIINPHSFGQTIENLFHLSFLVRVSCTPDVCPKKCSHKSVEFFDLYSLYSFYIFMTIE